MAEQDKKAEVIYPPNTLQAKVGTLGGGRFTVDPKIIQQAEKAVENLRVEFDGWLNIDITSLNNAYAAFTKARDAKNADALFRAAHDLRGQAQTFEYPLIARIASSLAKLIEGMQAREAVPLPLVAAHVDAIHVIHRDKIKDVSNLIAITLAEELEGRVLQTLEQMSAS